MKTYEYHNSSDSDYNLVDSQELNRSISTAKSSYSSSANSSVKSSAKRLHLHWLWNSLLNVLTKNAEPRIYQKYDRQGKLYFRVYDPISGMSSTLNTEQEVRAWLDQRYYS